MCTDLSGSKVRSVCVNDGLWNVPTVAVWHDVSSRCRCGAALLLLCHPSCFTSFQDPAEASSSRCCWIHFIRPPPRMQGWCRIIHNTLIHLYPAHLLMHFSVVSALDSDDDQYLSQRSALCCLACCGQGTGKDKSELNIGFFMYVPFCAAFTFSV